MDRIAISFERSCLSLMCFAAQLDDLPEDLVKLEALRELDVSHNLIKTFPPEMGRMQNLQMFVISNCKVQALPPEVRRHRNRHNKHNNSNATIGQRRVRFSDASCRWG